MTRRGESRGRLESEGNYTRLKELQEKTGGAGQNRTHQPFLESVTC
jgi:hypothetical protein